MSAGLCASSCRTAQPARSQAQHWRGWSLALHTGLSAQAALQTFSPSRKGTNRSDLSRRAVCRVSGIVYFKDSYNCCLKYLLNPRQFPGLCHHVPCNTTLLIHRLYSAFCSCLGNTWILNTSVPWVQPFQAAGQHLTESLPTLQCMSNPQTCTSGTSSCVPVRIVTPCSGPLLYNTSKLYCLCSWADLSSFWLVYTQHCTTVNALSPSVYFYIFLPTWE